jgi:hypothetical protein
MGCPRGYRNCICGANCKCRCTYVPPPGPPNFGNLLDADQVREIVRSELKRMGVVKDCSDDI